MPRCSRSTRPACRSTFSWWLTVGRLSPSVDLLGESLITVYVPVLAHRVRRIRDQLDQRIQKLIAELAPHSGAATN